MGSEGCRKFPFYTIIILFIAFACLSLGQLAHQTNYVRWQQIKHGTHTAFGSVQSPCNQRKINKFPQRGRGFARVGWLPGCLSN